jgi:hypothetical protein
MNDPIFEKLKNDYVCEDCRDTGYAGDIGPGMAGNHEYVECHCAKGQALKHDADRRLQVVEKACRFLTTAFLDAGGVEKMVEYCSLRAAIRRINPSIYAFDKRVKAYKLLNDILKLLEERE